MWSAWDTYARVPWWRRRWRHRTRAQRAVVIAFGLVVWFASVLAYGLVRREEPVRPPASVGAQPTRAAVVVPSATVTTVPPPTTTVTAPTVPTAQPAPAPNAEPAAAEVQRPPPDPPAATNCDAVSDDLGTAEPGGRVAFRPDPDCPYRPGSVTISVNGQPPQPAEVDENGVIWIEVGQ